MTEPGAGSSRRLPEGRFSISANQVPGIPFPLVHPYPYQPGLGHIPPMEMNQWPELYPGDSWEGWRSREPFAPRSYFTQTQMQKNCPHGMMVRQFVSNRMLCPSCGRQPFFGWLLVCVEDFVGHSDRLDPKGPQLSRGISQAIIDGHYNPEERATVRQQKGGVIKQVEELFGPAARAPQVQAIRGGACGHPKKGRDDGMHLEAIENIGRKDQDNPASPSGQSSQKRPAACRYWCCHHCRPFHYERTYIRLDAFCNDPQTEVTLPWEFGNRRVSNAKVVRSMDNHYEPREHLFTRAVPHPMASVPHALRRSHFRRNAMSLDLRALYHRSKASDISDGNRIAELNDSDSECSSSIDSTSGSVVTSEQGVVLLPAAGDLHDHENISGNESRDDDYGLKWLFHCSDPDMRGPTRSTADEGRKRRAH
ncbi:uncharacterized protein ACLA_076060 [Aspergillus clavatus NRRL 1]|uniref:Uncharacterized protein n=1 Tax=Aspergillus clavatus (strain ATCC 1007 / CBS 513.65 / DSM 816 / NCTC 3887 / NRRL 1 / QM 1276 / 107) TaxID=344612 RepID=A1C845_ASPCL|nr:uncharacterized protein ACLA_076060 [Aspergillus clavatus NRRL 1]EAW14566.1 conserved hypothetical protein [Aspergillus clavatus NRRL 1]